MALLDDFNRANGAVGSNWLSALTDTLFGINTNRAVGLAGAGWYAGVWAPSGTPQSFGPDCEAEITLIAADAGSAQQMGLLICGADLTGSSYDCYIGYMTAAGSCRLGRYINGAFTLLNTGSTVTPTAGHRLKVELIGSGTNNLKLYYDSGSGYTQVAAATDTTYSTGGHVGVSFNQSGLLTNGGDDFGAATLSGAAAVVRTLGTLGAGK